MQLQLQLQRFSLRAPNCHSPPFKVQRSLGTTEHAAVPQSARPFRPQSELLRAGMPDLSGGAGLHLHAILLSFNSGLP
jgi:hypothetical protein